MYGCDGVSEGVCDGVRVSVEFRCELSLLTLDRRVCRKSIISPRSSVDKLYKDNNNNNTWTLNTTNIACTNCTSLVNAIGESLVRELHDH